MKVGEQLKALREAIDQLDMDILTLFNKRMELSKEVGRIKAASGLTLFDPNREEIIIERLLGLNPGPLFEDSLRAIYREIFAASRLLQYVLRVAYLGPQWTYSHLAGLFMFGHSAQYVPSSTLEDVFDSLLKEKVQVAVVPIENSLQGGAGHTIDLLHDRDVYVVRECFLEIAHCLCGHTDALSDIQHLYAHPQSMDQCRRWVMENLRAVEWYECSSTAQAAQLAKKDPAGAAICNLYAAHHYGLRVLAERIEDHAGNTTRFFALARHPNVTPENNKTSLLFAVSDQPGALYAALEAFAKANVNIVHIESRANRVFPWQYLFFADIEGHEQQNEVKDALQILTSRTTFLKVLGSYMRGNPKEPLRLDKEKMRLAQPSL